MYSAINQPPAGYAMPATPELTDEERTELGEDIWRQLVLGRDDVADFLDYYQDTVPLSEERLAEMFTHARAARLAQLVSLPSGPNRLQAAFEELNAAGIVARADFSCCGTCGAAEIVDEVDDTRAWRGYVFFHQQDTETLVEDGTVYLSYGAFAPADLDQDAWDALPEAEQQARYTSDVRDLVESSVRPVLARHGITMTWTGDLATRLLLHDVDWFVPLGR